MALPVQSPRPALIVGWAWRFTGQGA